jgi:anti-anti-sigma regulatory factor
MHMSTIAMFLKINAESVADCLLEARANLDSGQGETILDFSAVRRIDPKALRAMEELLALADEKAVKIGLHGVNVDIYKVLKLVKLAPRFCLLT